MSTNIKIVFALLFCAGTLASCSSDPQKPGRIFMPDMTYSQAYETYSINPNFADSLSARLPVENTISYGMLPESYSATEEGESYHLSYMFKEYFANTNEDYERAGVELINPFPASDEVLKKGKTVFDTNCKVCHGDKGAGDGSIVQREVYPPVPAYEDRLPGITEGKMFYSIQYGKNLMGSYSSQISVDETWMVIRYIQKLGAVGPFAKKEVEETDEAEAGSEEETKVAQAIE